MSSQEHNPLAPVLELCSGDDKFVNMLELFKKNVPDIKAIDFFQPNSKLKLYYPSTVTNLQMYALLSFHFVRAGNKNKRSGISFIGRLGKNDNTPAIFFNRSHVLSLCNLLLNGNCDTTILISDTTMKKMWDSLHGNFRSCMDEESGRLFGNLIYQYD